MFFQFVLPSVEVSITAPILIWKLFLRIFRKYVVLYWSLITRLYINNCRWYDLLKMFRPGDVREYCQSLNSPTVQYEAYV